jgi:transcriptional regulator with XRE-family HTH domain
MTSPMTIISEREREFNRALGANIRQARRARGLPLADPAFGLDGGRLSRVERGRAGLRLKGLLKIAAALGVPASSLLPPKVSALPH